jgi:hypothetical protein
MPSGRHINKSTPKRFNELRGIFPELTLEFSFDTKASENNIISNINLIFWNNYAK